MRKFQIAVCTAQNFDGHEKEVEGLLREFFKELEGFNKRMVFLYGGSLGGYMSLFGKIASEHGFERIAIIPIQFEPEQCNGKIYDKESEVVVKSTLSFGGRNEMLVRSGDVVLVINGGKFGSGSLVETILAYHNCKKILVKYKGAKRDIDDLGCNFSRSCYNGYIIRYLYKIVKIHIQ